MSFYTPTTDIPKCVETLKKNFYTKTTSLSYQESIQYRKSQLHALYRLIRENKSKWYDALYKDLGKPTFEVDLPEIRMVLAEIVEALDHLESWCETEKPSPPLIHKTETCQIRKQPVGVVLIVSPWNYPLQLTLAPLVGAIAAGCAAVIKPSEHAPHCSQLLATLIHQYLDTDYYRVVQGGIPETTCLLEQHFDHIFYTGSTLVGKIVMAAAAKHLTPVTLELGGKNPCILAPDLTVEQVKTAAKRIAWAKFLNAGQTCIAPDYILVDPKHESLFIKSLEETLLAFYGKNPQSSPDYGRIINKQQHLRLVNLLERQVQANPQSRVCIGGQHDMNDCYIAPTIVQGVGLDATKNPLMEYELFGPILPIIAINMEQALSYILTRDRPLAAYLFTNDSKTMELFMNQTWSGGVCINDCIFQVAISSLPFGGIGASGMGAYHGKKSFDIFTHDKSVVIRSMGMEGLNDFRYPPFTDNKKWLADLITPSPTGKVMHAVYRVYAGCMQSLGWMGWMAAAYLYYKSRL